MTLSSTTTTSTTTSTTTTSTTTSTTMPNSITASTVAELVGCLDESEVGESAVRLWVTNTSSSDAYFDVQYTTDSGSTWTVLSDGEFISSSAAYMFLTPNFANNTTVYGSGGVLQQIQALVAIIMVLQLQYLDVRLLQLLLFHKSNIPTL